MSKHSDGPKNSQGYVRNPAQAGMTNGDTLGSYMNWKMDSPGRQNEEAKAQHVNAMFHWLDDPRPPIRMKKRKNRYGGK